MTYLLVFVCALGVDLFYVLWIRSVAGNRKLAAVCSSVAIGACSLAGVTSVVTDNAMAVPWLLGLGCGTYLGMIHDRTKQ